MNWDLQLGGVRKRFAQWGFSDLTRHLVSQGIDRVTFEAPVAEVESNPVLNFGDVVQIFHPSGVQWFWGTVIQTPLTASPAAETHGFVVAGPWWNLEENIFKQPWFTAVGTIYTGHLLLNVQPGPSLAHTQTQITTVLNYLLSLYGAGSKPFQVGTIEPITYPPVSEVNAISCAAALRSQLRWVPDAVVWFDYTTSPPTIHVRQRANLPQVSLAMTSDMKVDIVPRSDLIRPSVVVQYERSSTIDGKNQLQIITDIAPGGATGQEPRSLNLSISLAGPTITVTTGEILSEPIAPASLDWWKAKEESFRDPRYANLSITNVKRLLARTDEDFDDEEEEIPSSQLPFELIEGQIAPWMGFAHEQEVITAEATYDFYDKDPAQPDAKKITRVEKQKLAVHLVATDAVSGSYWSRETTDTGDPLPIGMAQFLYEALAALHYDGRIQWALEEVDGAVSIGQKVNLTGGRAEWAAMEALVQEVSEQVDSGITAVTVGPPKHIGADDLMELLRVGRRFRFTPADTQESGELGDAGNIRLGKPTANTAQGRGTPPHSLFVVKDGATLITLDAAGKRLSLDQGDSRTVVIDLDDIPSLPDVSKFPIQLREVIVCNAANEKKRMIVLASDMYDPETGD